MAQLNEEHRAYAWRLYTEVNGLVELWHYHRELSVEINDERHKIITELAPNFYKRILVETLSHAIVLGIARATDKRAKKKNDTISIYGLPKRIPKNQKESFEKLINKKEEYFKKIEKWRHNHLAHNGKDFDAEKLKLINADLKEGLEAVSEVICAALPIFSLGHHIPSNDISLPTKEIGLLFERLKENK